MSFNKRISTLSSSNDSKNGSQVNSISSGRQCKVNQISGNIKKISKMILNGTSGVLTGHPSYARLG
jgi:hypothetical protein